MGGSSERKAPREPGRILIAAAEDGVADTIQPRLTKLGADLSLIEALEKPFTLDDAGCMLLHEFMKVFKPTLTIIDPIFAYVGNKDVNKQGDARQIMNKLGGLAKHHNCSIVCVRHLNKGNGTSSVNRGSGSIDWRAAARSVLLVGVDPTDKSRRAVVQTKNNLGPTAESIGFTVDQGQFAWTGKSTLTEGLILTTEKDAVAEACSIQDAVEFLEQVLASGPLAQQEISREADRAGISYRTLRRAKEKLKIRSHKVGLDRWVWELQTTPAMVGR